MFSRSLFLLLSFVCVLGCAPLSLQAQVPSVRHTTTIVVSKGAPPLKLAVEELRKYLAAMGNPKPRIVLPPGRGDIYVGTMPSDLPPEVGEAINTSLHGKDVDAFVIRSVGNRLVIYGNSARATLYGAYHYLNTLGVRWYFPGSEGEVIPRASVKLSGYNVIQVPSFHKRGIVIFSTTPGFEELVDFAAKVKLNTIGLHAIPFGPQSWDVGLADAERSTSPRGLNLDVERHFFGENFCPDDTAMLDHARADFTAYVKTLPPDMNEFFLWPADRYLAPCSSPEYRDYSVSDLILWFDKQMLETLRSVRPEAKFAFLSYLSTWEPPRHEKPIPGLVLEWAPMNQSFAHALDDSASAANAEYQKDFGTLIQMFGAENSQVLGYWLDDTLFSRTLFCKLPYVPKALQGDLTYYHRMGVPAITTFGVITGRDYFTSHVSPAVFLYPLLLWNIQEDTRKTMRDFAIGFFGSEQAVEVFDLLSRADQMVFVERHRLHAQKVGNPTFVETVTEALGLAQKLLVSQTNPAGKARVARLIQEVSSRFISPIGGESDPGQ